MTKTYFFAESVYDSNYSGSSYYATMIMAEVFIEGLKELKKVVCERTGAPFEEFSPFELIDFDYFFGELDGKHSECVGDIDGEEGLTARDIYLQDDSEPLVETASEYVDDDSFLMLATEDEVNSIFLPIIEKNNYPMEGFGTGVFKLLNYIDTVSTNEVKKVQADLKKFDGLRKTLIDLNFIDEKSKVDSVEKTENGILITSTNREKVTITKE